MNFIESTESVEFEKYFWTKDIFEAASTCVRNCNAATALGRHR